MGGADWREDWECMFRGLREELDYEITEVEGQLPKGLRGCFWRNGPGFFELGGQTIAPVDGDGMVVRIAFDGQGSVRFTNRYVETVGYLKERAAGKVLFRGVFGTLPHDEEHLRGQPMRALGGGPKNTANTSLLMLPRQRRLLALWEGGSAHSLDPQTLETHGVETLGGTLPASAVFSAHPCFDENTQRLVGFGVRPGPVPKCAVYEFDVSASQPRLVQEHRVKLKGQAIIHACCATANWIILVHNPVKMDMKGLRIGASVDDFLKGENSQKARTRVIVLPREPGRWGCAGGTISSLQADYEVPQGFSYHHAGAWEDPENGDILLDTVEYRQKPPLDMRNTAIGSNAMSYASPQGGGLLKRMRLPAPAAPGQQTPQRRVERLVIPGSPLSCEMPVVRPGRLGQPHRFIYCVDTVADPSGHPSQRPWAALVKLDTLLSQQTRWACPPRSFCGEPVFVPRREEAPGGADCDDGWLLSLVFDAAKGRSSLVVLDATDIAKGPVCRLHFRTHVPFSHHCMWTPQYYGPKGGNGSLRPAKL
eukprot:TRINITY_DN16117_c0_g1_i1.p1 TRINITY_DN16117_c0_g1~~TRINITY_DN16117_c0_g1_i1.p1  ORF type:complete len:560 (+),score=123.51 TRINITY_DN16117_c0_g1_i1:74-1681(+)